CAGTDRPECGRSARVVDGYGRPVYGPSSAGTREGAANREQLGGGVKLMKKCSSAQVAAQPIAGYCIRGGRGARPRRNAALVRRGAGSMVAWRPESPPDSLPGGGSR